MDDEIKGKIQAQLDRHRIMSIATLRHDGWPQATTVGYVNDALTIYFLCGLDSQKAANIAADNRVSIAINDDPSQIMTISGVSLAGHAHAVTEREEAEKVLALLPTRYPEQKALTIAMPKPGDIRIFRVTPTVISLLDYAKGFGHNDLVTC